MPRSSLAADFWNSVQDEVEQRTIETYKFLVRELMASGYPPGSEPVPEHQEYLRLVELKLTGNPMFTSSAAAQQRLRELELQFGPAPSLPPSFAPAPGPAQPLPPLGVLG